MSNIKKLRALMDEYALDVQDVAKIMRRSIKTVYAWLDTKNPRQIPSDTLELLEIKLRRNQMRVTMDFQDYLDDWLFGGNGLESWDTFSEYENFSSITTRQEAEASIRQCLDVAMGDEIIWQQPGQTVDYKIIVSPVSDEKISEMADLWINQLLPERMAAYEG